MINNNYNTVTSASCTINTNSSLTANAVYIPYTTTTTASSSNIKN